MLGDKGWGAIFAAICGNKDSKIMSMDASNGNIGPAGGKLIAEALCTSVTGALTSLNLSSNNLCPVTEETGYIKASQVQGSSFNEGDKVVYQGKEMIVSKAKDRDGDIKMTNLPDMTGLNALADAFRVNGSLTSIDVRGNKITGDGAAQLSAAVLGNLKIEMFNGIPIKEMRADSITELDLKDKMIGDEGGMVVAGLIPAMSLAELRLGGLKPVSDGSVFGPEVRADLVQSVLTLAAHLRHLDICGLEVGVTEAIALVSTCRALQTLRLGDWVMPVGELHLVKVVSTGGQAVCEADGAVLGALLKASTSLSTLNLSGSSCVPAALARILEGLKASAAPLAELRLGGQAVSEAEGAVVGALLRAP